MKGAFMPRGFDDLFGDLHPGFAPRRRRGWSARRPPVEAVPVRPARHAPRVEPICEPLPVRAAQRQAAETIREPVSEPRAVAPPAVEPPDPSARSAIEPAAADDVAAVADRNTTEKLRARFEREAERTVAIEKRHVLADMLEVLDDLDRALEAASAHEGEARAASVQQGVELVRERFLAKLAAHGVRRVDDEGAVFDPERHEAVSVTPVADEALDGRVLHVVRAGYAIGDELLRPAAVVVGRG